MKHINKIATVLCGAALGILTLTGCEGSDLYKVNEPDNLQKLIDSIAATKVVVTEDLSDCQEDVYTVGATDFSSGFWTAFSKYYVIPDGKKFKAQFQLSINPSAPNTYKNFALIVTNDVNRNDDGYTEYGAIRYDHQPSGNSEWGSYFEQYRSSCVESNLTFATDTDEGVQKLGGTVTLVIDRSVPDSFGVKITNGTVTKTYKQKKALPNLNADASNSNIRIFLVPEGSYINFLKANIEPIGGFTSAEDKQPTTLKLNGMPDEVLVGTTLEEAMANVTANVYFDGALDPKVVPASELLISTESDFTTPGEKQILVIYNKTFKGANADKPIYQMAYVKVVESLSVFTQKVVFPTPQILGAEDNSSAWWSLHTENIKVAPRETAVSSFYNYGTCVGNWNNYNIVLCANDNSEYAVVRSDNFGWGKGYDGCDHSLTPAPADDDAWAAWRQAMNGAKVTAYITNNGDGTATVKTISAGTDGNTYTMIYDKIKIDKDDFYFNYTIDSSHLVFDKELGASDCSTGWWGAHSQNIQIPAHTACTMSFTNYSNGAGNWNNFVVVLDNVDTKTEYAVVRADNYGWGTGYAACTHTCNQGSDEDWAAWRSAMNGAQVDLTITNHGNGLADVEAVMHGTDGKDYTQTYTGINNVTPDDFYFRLTVDGSYLNFYPTVASARKFVQVNRNRVIRR